ncbi:hypothetical protein F5B19DRAFT_45272 [Rostrohypoxylon terebratum]|nr:hypothetical protein F5B19DRAFT_45272 [Rostrohypoxylon terebratum]
MQIATILLVLTSMCVGSEASAAMAVHRNDTVSRISTARSTSNSGKTPEKDIRTQCDSGSFELVHSQERPNIYYLRGVCSGLYKNTHDPRCSFLDLSMCYINDRGNMVAQRFGNFYDSCTDCTLYAASGSNMLACTCARGPGTGGGTQITGVQLDDLLYVKNGFLSCYGYTNFECPYLDVPY